VNADLDREILIDGTTYVVSGIDKDAGSPSFDKNSPNGMWWRITLERPYEGPPAPRRLYAMGAQIVAPAFTFDVPTNLIWAGAADNCLPTYPLPDCVSG
jgi:hypothetical protein